MRQGYFSCNIFVIMFYVYRATWPARRDLDPSKQELGKLLHKRMHDDDLSQPLIYIYNVTLFVGDCYSGCVTIDDSKPVTHYRTDGFARLVGFECSNVFFKLDASFFPNLFNFFPLTNRQRHICHSR